MEKDRILYERVREISKEAASILIGTDCFQLAPPGENFIFNSGLASPMKIEMDQLQRDPEAQWRICELLSEMVKRNFPELPDKLVGVIRGGSPLATNAGLILHVQSAARLGNDESPEKLSYRRGDIRPGEEVVIVEDVTTTGANSIVCAERVRLEGGIVLGVVSVFSYRFPRARVNFENHQLPFYFLTDFETLVNTLVNRGVLEEAAELIKWHVLNSS